MDTDKEVDALRSMLVWKMVGAVLLFGVPLLFEIDLSHTQAYSALGDLLGTVFQTIVIVTPGSLQAVLQELTLVSVEGTTVNVGKHLSFRKKALTSSVNAAFRYFLNTDRPRAKRERPEPTSPTGSPQAKCARVLQDTTICDLPLEVLEILFDLEDDELVFLASVGSTNKHLRVQTELLIDRMHLASDRQFQIMHLLPSRRVSLSKSDSKNVSAVVLRSLGAVEYGEIPTALILYQNARRLIQSPVDKSLVDILEQILRFVDPSLGICVDALVVAFSRSTTPLLRSLATHLHVQLLIRRQVNLMVVRPLFEQILTQDKWIPASTLIAGFETLIKWPFQRDVAARVVKMVASAETPNGVYWLGKLYLDGTVITKSTHKALQAFYLAAPWVSSAKAQRETLSQSRPIAQVDQLETELSAKSPQVLLEIFCSGVEKDIVYPPQF